MPPPKTASWPRRAAATLLLLFAGLAISSCGDGRTPLVLYSPHGRDLLTLIEGAYEALHPEIDVRWLDMGSQEIYDRLRSERANPQADVWFGGPWSIFARGAREDLLAPFRPAWSTALHPEERHPQDLFFALYRTPPLLVYNTQAVEAEDAPADWSDLLLERWRGRIVIRDPLASGTMRTIFGYLIADSLARTGDTRAGFEFLCRLDGQTKEYVHSPALMHEKIIRQEGLVTLWELTDILTLIAGGAPLGYRFPKSGSPVIPDAVGVVQGAPHIAGAQAFVDWVGSREAVELAAEQAFRLPARDDIPVEELPEWSARVLEEMIPATVDWNLLEERGSEWMGEWDRAVRGQCS